MGSNYFGDLNLGNERSSSTNNNCSRKGKKSSPDKSNKQPQRGLGVAQLEKIRLHSQMGSSTYNLPPSNHHHRLPFPSNIQEDMRRQTAYSSSPSFSNSSSFGFPVQQQSFMVRPYYEMGLSEMGSIRYPDYVHQSIPTSRWNHGNDIPLSQPSLTRHFLTQQEEEDFLEKRRKQDQIGSMVLRSQDDPDESNGNQELDLELKLSL